ncbi:hypothetical protein ACHAXT_009723 [Thalassiosira profunda]
MGSSATKIERTRKRSMWMCDVCRVAKFEDKAEAIAHENACQGGASSFKRRKLEEDGEASIPFLDLTQDENKEGGSTGLDAGVAAREGVDGGSQAAVTQDVNEADIHCKAASRSSKPSPQRKKSPVTTAAALNSSSSSDDDANGAGEFAPSPSGAPTIGAGDGETGNRSTAQCNVNAGMGKTDSSKSQKKQSPVAAAAMAALASSSDEDADGVKDATPNAADDTTTDAIIGANVSDFVASQGSKGSGDITNRIEGTVASSRKRDVSSEDADAGKARTKGWASKSPVARAAIAVLELSSSDDDTAPLSNGGTREQCAASNQNGDGNAKAFAKAPHAVDNDNKAADSDEEDRKPPANPILGVTVLVSSGAFAGLQGVIVATGHGWWTLDNPLITGKVKGSDCKFVEDGKEVDFGAIEAWYKKRGRLHRMPPIVKRGDIRGQNNDARITVPPTKPSARVPNDDKEEERKPPANPFLGATVLVSSGAFAGLQGVVVATEARGWWTIGNPLITGKVRGCNCQFVDDGKADFGAIEAWYRKNSEPHRMPPIVKSGNNTLVDCGEQELATALLSLDDRALSSVDDNLKRNIAWKLNRLLCPDQEAFDALPRGMQKEVSESDSAELEGEKKGPNSNTTRPIGEARRLQNHLQRGLHDTAFNGPASFAASNGTSVAVDDDAESSRPKRLAYIGVDARVEKRHWNDAPGDLDTDRPIHFDVVPRHLKALSSELTTELVALFRGKKEDEWDNVRGKGRISKPQRVERDYYKTHVRDVGSHLRSLNILPGCFQIKEKAAQQMMMFLNTKEGTCVTHFDRDSSALYVVAGLKTVMVAPPMPEQDRPPDGLLHDIDPFSRDWKRHGKQQDGSVMKWGRIDLAPGDVEQSVTGDAASKVWEPSPVLPIAPLVVRQKAPVGDEMSTSAAPSVVIPRSSSRPQRKVHKCGVCAKPGFNEEEMWILSFDWQAKGGEKKWVAPSEMIQYPTGAEAPILTVDEFCSQSNIERRHFRRYSYVTGSKDDYTTAFLNDGEAQHDRLEREAIQIKCESVVKTEE